MLPFQFWQIIAQQLSQLTLNATIYTYLCIPLRYPDLASELHVVMIRF